MTVTALIVDDERLARTELRRLLGEHEQISVVGEAKEAGDALELIDDLDPDLLFLDIKMPGKDGFELLEELDRAPAVVFTTAYDEYAIKAFEVNALDYLVKPIEPSRLATAVEKIVGRLEAEEAARQREDRPDGSGDEEPERLTEWDRVFVKDGDDCWFVQLGEVRFFESAGNYTILHLVDERPMVQRSLTYLEERLDPRVFFRASRQHIVNLKRVESIDPWFSGRMLVRLEGGHEIEISRRRAVEFRKVRSL